MTILKTAAEETSIIWESRPFPPIFRMGNQISRIKSSYELFCALIWKLPHFLPKFEFPLIHSLVSGAFLHVLNH